MMVKEKENAKEKVKRIRKRHKIGYGKRKWEIRI